MQGWVHETRTSQAPQHRVDRVRQLRCGFCRPKALKPCLRRRRDQGLIRVESIGERLTCWVVIVLGVGPKKTLQENVNPREGSPYTMLSILHIPQSNTLTHVENQLDVIQNCQSLQHNQTDQKTWTWTARHALRERMVLSSSRLLSLYIIYNHIQPPLF